MRAIAIAALTTATIGLAACSSWSGSRLNPSNWFGSSEPVATTASNASESNPLIPEGSPFARDDAPPPGVLISEITDLTVESGNTGAIIVATGVATRQGAFAPRLVPLDTRNPVDENGTMVLQFLVRYPVAATPAGSTATRTITAARSVSVQDLAEIRTIRVDGATNARETRRR